jgi:hypothetical protein
MPKLHLELTTPCLTRLQGVVARHNAEHGTRLTLLEWLTLHLQELAIQDELTQRILELQRQAETDLNAALHAEKEMLLEQVRKEG